MQLPFLKKADGEVRKVGLELEFSGLELKDAARIIQQLYGGTVRKSHRYQYIIENTAMGDFEVELDARILKKLAETYFSEEFESDFDEQKLKDSIGDLLEKMARTVVPLEIVMPPVPADQLAELEQLRMQLHQQKATGTASSWIHAFGLHVNIEAPDLKPETLVAYLKAFFIIYPWLLETLDINFSRRLSPFIDHFPVEYVRQVLDPGYHPAQEQLIEDYLSYNTTRNRPLDMMPILALLDAERIDGVLEGEKNKARPTFHYRLPNSQIDDPEWSFGLECKRWLHVESLAFNDEMLEKLSRLYLLREGEILVSFRKEWAQTVSIMLDLDLYEKS